MSEKVLGSNDTVINPKQLIVEVVEQGTGTRAGAGNLHFELDGQRVIIPSMQAYDTPSADAFLTETNSFMFRLHGRGLPDSPAYLVFESQGNLRSSIYYRETPKG